MLKEVRRLKRNSTDEEKRKDKDLIQERKSSFDKEGSQVWEILAGGSVRPIDGLEITKEKINRLPEKYVTEETLVQVNISTEFSGVQLVLVPGVSDYGFVSQPIRLKKMAEFFGKRITDGHLVLDEDKRILFNVQQLTITKKELEDNFSLFLQEQFSDRPVILSNISLNGMMAWFSRNDSIVGQGTSLEYTKVNPMVKFITAQA